MDRRDLAELRKRFKKEACTITRMAGCYVDINRNKIMEFNENFLNLPDEEFYKFLDIAKKTLGGTVGNNILEVSFAPDELNTGKQQFFMGLKASALKNNELLERLYDIIIEEYKSLSNYLILVYHDCYDIMSRTSDKQKLDESEEVFEYLLVSICPVELSKAGLSYIEDEGRIGARIRDRVVGAPVLGFMFPAFTEGSADVDKVAYFVKDAKDSKGDFIENVLGCGAKRTGVENRRTFEAIVKEAFKTADGADNDDKAAEAIIDIQESFKIRCDEEEDEDMPLSAPIVLDAKVIEAVLAENDIPEGPAEAIKEYCEEEFKDEAPEISVLVDEKALEKSLEKREKQELVKEVASLKSQLGATSEENEIVLRVSEEKADRIKTEFIGEQRYVMIPVDASDEVKVNGRITEF